MKILAVVGSPRKGANSTILSEQLVAGAGSQGAETRTIHPAKMKIAPCLACNGCYKTGRCIVQDEYQAVYDMIIDSDAIVLATPIYFGAVSAQVKPFIDRAQCFWAMRDIVKATMPPGPGGGGRKGVLIATSGMDNKAKMFAGAHTTFTYFMRSLQGEVWAEIYRGGLEAPGEIRQDAEAMQRAHELGRRLALGLDPG